MVSKQVHAQLVPCDSPTLAELDAWQSHVCVVAQQKVANVAFLQVQDSCNVPHAQHVAVSAQHRVWPRWYRCVVFHGHRVSQHKTISGSNHPFYNILGMITA